MSQSKNDNNITILDGGMGRELLRIGAPFAQPEWSALSLIESPDMVELVHQHFIDAGAEIITTNTYALVPFHIGQPRFEKQAYDLAKLAACIAKKLADENGIKVAGCIPPAFGSYKPELFIPQQAEGVLTPLITGQKDHIDFWIVETMSSCIEAQATIDIIKKHSDLPIYLSFSLNNRGDLSQPITLRSNEDITKIEPILPQIDAVLFNCSQPEEMEQAIQATKKINGTIPIGAYANNFSELKRSHAANESVSKSRDDITPEKYLEFAQKWVSAGATIIGGCCGIGPDHIRLLNQSLK